MIGTVYKEAKEIFGKDFVLAGILPAAMLLFAILWYELGWSNVKSLTATWISSKSEFTSGAIFAVGCLFVTALIVFSVRQPVLNCLRYLPYSFLRPVRERLRANQFKKLLAIEQELELVEWKYTVAMWHKRDFAPGKYTPSFIRDKSEAQALRESARAREEASSIVSAKLMTLGIEGTETLITGLGALHVFLTRNKTVPPEISAEVQQWNDLLNSTPRMGLLFELLEARILPQFVDVFEKKNAFPSLRWIQPTALGNEIAALDDYSESRYGIETSALWPRLREVIPAHSRDDVATAEVNIEIIANFLIATASISLVVLGTFVWRHHVDSRGILALVVLIGLEVLLYRSAVYATGIFRHKVIGLIDVYLLMFLYSMGHRPTTDGQRREILSSLKERFVNGTPLVPSTSLQAPAGFKDVEKTT